MKKLIIPLSIICLCFGKTPRYGDEQISVLINEYFKTTPSAPMLLGHRFYKEKGERVFQIEIEGKDANIRNELLFGFSAMSQFANVSKTKFRQFILIIHFENHVVPVVAKSDIACLKSFFIDQTIDELNWRKKCLNIKEM
tara:strand:+ start:300 stop:719 length:420 start_codon:yes stop_codon:yes gene_type:complete